MNQHECLLGLYFDYEDRSDITESNIVKYALFRYDLCIQWCQKGTGAASIIESTLKATPTKLLEEQADLFDYCPKCGVKIDWERISKHINTRIQKESIYYPWAKARLKEIA